MPGCSAIGCNNRSEKGFTMKCFPRDPELRDIWKQRVGRADWEPSNNSFLCHAHFESDQWLVSSNGKVKLRKGAVPSIFNITSTRKSAKKKLNPGIQIVEEEDLGEYEVEYLENDGPYIFNTNNQKKFQNILSVPTKNSSTKLSQILDNVKLVSNDQNIIIYSDRNNKELEKLINGNNIVIVENEREKENMDSLSKNDKSQLEIKLEIKKESSENGLSLHDYDEIERKLQEICDSENETDTPYIKEKNKNNDYLDSSIKNSNLEIGSDKPIAQIGTKRKRVMHYESPRKGSRRKSSHSSSVKNQLNFTDDASDLINDLETENFVEYIIPDDSPDINIEKNVNKPIIKKDVHIALQKNKNVHCVNNRQQIEQLQTKLDVQSEVIENITHQLISYKDMEKKLKSITEKLQDQKKKNDILIRKVASKKLPVEKKCKTDTFNLKNASEADLRDRIELLEVQNRNLNKSIAIEDQNRKKLEYQIKSRDNQIKEMNWKLEKASKFIDRAEKNTNNYKRKLQNLQSQIKRKRVLNNKTSSFDILLICQSNQSYSAKAFRIALDIVKTCGIGGYEKLLSYEFPLPTLTELSKMYPEEVKNCYEPSEDGMIFESRESINSANEDSTIEIKMENIQYFDSDLVSDPEENVTGTVQDILNESSDHEELNLNELRRHIKLNLNNTT